MSPEIAAVREGVEQTNEVMKTISKTIGQMQEISASVGPSFHKKAGRTAV